MLYQNVCYCCKQRGGHFEEDLHVSLQGSPPEASGDPLQVANDARINNLHRHSVGSVVGTLRQPSNNFKPKGGVKSDVPQEGSKLQRQSVAECVEKSAIPQPCNGFKPEVTKMEIQQKVDNFQNLSTAERLEKPLGGQLCNGFRKEVVKKDDPPEGLDLHRLSLTDSAEKPTLPQTKTDVRPPAVVEKEDPEEFESVLHINGKTIVVRCGDRATLRVRD